MANVANQAPEDGKTYEGGCHCGATKYRVKIHPPIEEQKVASCNCMLFTTGSSRVHQVDTYSHTAVGSICNANGYLLVYPKRENFEVLSGENAISVCGSRSFMGHIVGVFILSGLLIPPLG